MSSKMVNRVIISGGGTGGHIFPALAIADEIKKRNPKAEILFVGARGRMEMEKIPQAGYEIIGLPIAGLQRKLTWKNLLLPFKLLRSFYLVLSVIRKFKPEIVIGVGGYASGPTLQMAQLLGIPTLLQEQNSYPGKTNKILAKKAKAICVAYPSMDRFFPEHKIHYLGNPVRSNLATDLNPLKADAAAFFGLDANKPTLLVIGGSLGALTLNESIFTGLEKFQNSNIQVLWQCGKSFEAKFLAGQNQLPTQVKLLAFIQRMDFAYALADVIISRAGALSVSELALVGKPCILVPSPNVAEDHQTKNALSLVDQSAALLVKDAAARATLLDTCFNLLSDSAKQKELSGNLQKLALPEATQAIVNVCEKVITA
ncbi:MAG: undecaprenyldiphospho-muramoylpentapeptide beta-N-acetylglucosaminyltransferase [Flavobacteriales bacterium]